MTAHEFLISKKVVSLKESYSVYGIQKWLEEYAQIVLNIAAKKAEIKQKPLHPLLSEYEGIRNPYIDLFEVSKESIINCLKD